MQKLIKMPITLCNCLFALLLITSFTAVAAPTISFTYADQSSENISIPERSGLISIKATLSEVQPNDVSFSFGYVLGTAEIFKDFNFPVEVTGDISGTAKSANITIAAGQTTQTFFLVNILDDIFDEEDETLLFSIGNPQGAILAQNNINLIIVDDEKTPTIVLASSTINRDPDGAFYTAINENEGGVDLELKLTDENNRSSFPIVLSYEISQAEGINPLLPDFRDPGSDNEPFQTGKLILAAESSERKFQISIEDDQLLENQETITFKLTSAEHAIIHETRNTIVITINDDDANAGVINDTGVTRCYDDAKNIIDCNSASGFPSMDQDGSQSSPNRFIKLNNKGQVLSSTSNLADCVYDENTNLVWQINKDSYSFSWLNKISSVNGGDVGFEGGEGTAGSTCGPTNPPCNTDHYAEVLNSLAGESASDKGLCNIKNWRLPKLRELMSIMDFEPDNELVLISEQYFNVTRFGEPGATAAFYWTSTPAAVTSEKAWCVYFGKIKNPHIDQCEKNLAYPVRMVATCNAGNPPC